MKFLQERRLKNSCNFMPDNRTFLATVFAVACIFLTGCGQTKVEKTVSGIYFDTYISITTYDNTSEEVLREALSECERYELIFSKTNSDSELFRLNNRDNNISESNLYYETYISEDMFNCLKQCIHFSEVTDNKYNPALGTVIKLWDYHAQNPTVPDEDVINEAIKHADINSVRLSDEGTKEQPYSIQIDDDALQLDLGGAAKGYIANRLVDFLKDKGTTNALIALGGNVYCIGDKFGNPFNVGIQKPFSSKGEIITSVKASDVSVVTSGIYERYFEQDGTIYHHIIDSFTGYPVQNDLVSVTVICQDSLKADILSTALLCMGSEAAADYAKKDDSIQVILVTDENEIIEVK